MKTFLSKQFYQRYFSAVRCQHADWLGVVPEQARLEMLAHLLQWDLRPYPPLNLTPQQTQQPVIPTEGTANSGSGLWASPTT